MRIAIGTGCFGKNCDSGVKGAQKQIVVYCHGEAGVLSILIAALAANADRSLSSKQLRQLSFWTSRKFSLTGIFMLPANMTALFRGMRRARSKTDFLVVASIGQRFFRFSRSPGIS